MDNNDTVIDKVSGNFHRINNLTHGSMVAHNMMANKMGNKTSFSSIKKIPVNSIANKPNVYWVKVF